MLRIEAVSKAFRGGKYGVRALSLEARPGVLGLLGPNGAGKTTLMQMIATVTKPTAGRILVDDIDLTKDPEAIRRRLGYLPQDFGVYDNLTAFELLDYVGRLKGVRSRARVNEMLEMVNLHTAANRRLGGFSGGMKQRLGIAQALISNPDLVIVDEATAGLDPEERVRFRNVLSDLSGRRLVILSTHIVSRGVVACGGGLGLGSRRVLRGIRSVAERADRVGDGTTCRRRAPASRGPGASPATSDARPA
jgi:ABC-2 type transport system ATP-binding protein